MEILQRIVDEKIIVRNPSELDIKELSEKGFWIVYGEDWHSAKAFVRRIEYNNGEDQVIEVK
jgi:hypothetical protein